MYGVGLVAQAGKLQDTVEVASLIQQLTQANPPANAQNIANSMYGVGLVAQAGKLQDTVAVASLIQKLTQADLHANAQNIANCVYGLGLLVQTKVLTREEVTKIKIYVDESLFSSINNTVFNLREYTQVTQGLVYLSYELSSQQIELLKTRQPTPNTQQVLLKEKLSERFFSVETEKLIGAHFVDLYLEVNDKKYVIELDGSQHYDDKGQLMPKDQMRDNFLKEKGYTVLRYLSSCSIEDITTEVENAVNNKTNAETQVGANSATSGLSGHATLFTSVTASTSNDTNLKNRREL